MKKDIITILFSLRASVYRLIFPRTEPLSRKFGIDRGTPIDRYWIEDFLNKNKSDIKGTVLEIGDDRYTVQFGQGNVIKSDVLDVTPNPKATIIADLSNATQVYDNTYDCIILTHVLGMIPDFQRAIAECYRILKPNGILLVTVSSLSPAQKHSPGLWRFTDKGLGYAIGKVFGDKYIQTGAYGNVYTGQCFWVGMSQEDITKKELDINDPEYPCIATCRAKKQ